MLKGKVPIIVAAVLAAGAALLIAWQLQLWRAEATRGWQLGKVIVAATDLQPGNQLTSDSVRYEMMPRKFIYDNVLAPDDLTVAIGREVVYPIRAGEPVHWYQLKGVRSLERLSATLPDGARAISIEVTDRSSVAQWVRPNDQVDVLGTFRDASSNQMVAVTLLQKVVVLATGRAGVRPRPTGQGIEQYATVTLKVLPEEAEIIVLAQELGTLYMTLRNDRDSSTVEDRAARTTMETLMTGERVKKLHTKRIRTIQVVRGIKAPKPGR